MATMTSIGLTKKALGMVAVCEEWRRTLKLISQDEIRESEVKKALTALLTTAKRRGSEDRRSEPRDAIIARWEDVVYFVVTARTLGTEEVHGTLAVLNMAKRYLPAPKRARIVSRRPISGTANNGEVNVVGASVFEGVPC